MRHAKDRPWNYPVPVKTSKFTSLFKKHEKLNIETDLAFLKAFNYTDPAVDRSQLLYSDLQCNIDSNVEMRLGSGRSGFYKGKYIKGIGRTPLAGNWNDEYDFYHNSGLLLASSAAREYVVSQLFEVKKKSNLIVPCEGILLRIMKGKQTQHLKAMFWDEPGFRQKPESAFHAINSKVHAISVKNGHFFRYSNLVWWLNFYPQYGGQDQRSALGYFFESLVYMFGSSQQVIGIDFSPAEIANTMAEQVTTSLNLLMDGWAQGVAWNSYHNNFCIDGRFLDLETPTIYPVASMGEWIDFDQAANKQLIKSCAYTFFEGFQLLQVVFQIRHFYYFLRSKLQLMIDMDTIHPVEKQYCRAFLESLKKQFGNDHPIMGHKSLEDLVCSKMAHTLDLSSKETKQLQRMFRNAMIQQRLYQPRGKSGDIPSTTLHRIDMPEIAEPEPCASKAVFFAPDFMVDRLKKHDPVNIKANEILLACDASKNMDDLMSILKQAKRKLRHA